MGMLIGLAGAVLAAGPGAAVAPGPAVRPVAAVGSKWLPERVAGWGMAADLRRAELLRGTVPLGLARPAGERGP